MPGRGRERMIEGGERRGMSEEMKSAIQELLRCQKDNPVKEES